ncbi:ABC transporter ATP-binding protein, partial [Anaerobranca gottschalkii]|uniref:ABC transporter ATP-binding protein n=1 Tax=Anaerobranca gottschalkii TaxID=108328 RepID=UPI00115FA9AF
MLKGPSFVALGDNPSRGQRGAPVVKAKDIKRTLKGLWHYFKREKTLLLILFGLVLISTAIALWIPYLIGQGIDALERIGGGEELSLIKITLLLLTVIYLADTTIQILQEWIVAQVSQQMFFRLRKSLFSKLQKLPLVYFDKHTHGEIMSRLSNDIDNISTTVAQSAIQLMSSILTISGSFVMMIILSPLLTLASIVTIPLVYFVTKKITEKTRLYFRRQQEYLGKLNGHIEEMISGIWVVKAFNSEEDVIKSFDDINLKLQDVGIKAQIWSGFMMPLMNVIKNIGFTSVAGVGGILAVNGIIDVWIIASFIIYSKQFVRPLNEVASIYNTLQSGIAGAERVFEVLEEEEEIEDNQDGVILDKAKGHIIFQNVRFRYPNGEEVLKNLSFEIQPGTSVAIVGRTGAGKTTIINLLTRFYEINGGKILIDGQDIKNYTRESLRKSFGIVLQDTYLFSGTIRENIRYGKLSATDHEVEQAARLAYAHNFIKKLPRGYDTILSESGSNLSSGQKQLIAIARAILADPAILILDEATSNIDTRTEIYVQRGMWELMKNRTSFIIAHRLSTIRDADIIMVIDKGQIVEMGDHNTLMAKKGVYYKLYNI